MVKEPKVAKTKVSLAPFTSRSATTAERPSDVQLEAAGQPRTRFQARSSQRVSPLCVHPTRSTRFFPLVGPNTPRFTLDSTYNKHERASVPTITSLALSASKPFVIMESSFNRRMRAATEGSNITAAGIAGPSSPTKRRPREESWSGGGSSSMFGGLLGGGPPSPSKKRIYGDR